jgi:hypothetical protein
MFALLVTSFHNIWRGDYATAYKQSHELLALAEEKGASLMKAIGMLIQGGLLALTGDASKAAQMITSGISACRSTGATFYIPCFLSYLAVAYADIGQFDEAWRCVGEAITAVETTGETKLDKLDAMLAQSSTSAQDAALFADMLLLPNASSKIINTGFWCAKAASCKTS